MLDTPSSNEKLGEEKSLDGMSKDCVEQLTLESVLQAVVDILNEIMPDDDPPPDGGSPVPQE